MDLVAANDPSYTLPDYDDAEKQIMLDMSPHVANGMFACMEAAMTGRILPNGKVK